MKKNDANSQVMMPREKPDVAQLISDMEGDMASFASYANRLERSDEIQQAWWQGQTEDGRKHDTDEMEATPFDGSSDQRIRISEEVVNERVLIQKAAMIGGRSTFKPKNSGTAKDAALFSTLMGHYMEGAMRQEVRDETDYLLEWKEGGGIAVLFVGWLHERALEPRMITEDDLVQFAVNAGLMNAGLPAVQALQQSAQDGSADPAMLEQAAGVAEVSEDDLRQMMLDPARTNELVRQIQAFDPEVTKAEALRVARAMQAGEEGDYFAPYTKESRPMWEALQPGVDVFFSGSARKLQKAPRITRVHWLTETDLRDRAQVEGWDKDWLKLVLKNPGRHFTWGLESGAWVMSGSATRYEFMSDDELIRAKFYQVAEVYSRRSSIAGAPCIYRTVLHGSVNNACGVHEVLKYKHGKYPFLEFRRERKKRPLCSPRSINELLTTNQDALKSLHDARRNRIDLANSPPVITTGRRTGGRIRIGPDMEIPEARAGTLRWFEPPQLDMDTVDVAQDERSMVDKYFGRWSKDVPQPVVQMHNQALVNDWLLDLGEAVTMTAQLIQQYVSDEEASRIVGMDYDLDATRKAIQAEYNLTISFDVRDLDLDWLKKKMEMLNEGALSADTMGVIDRGKYVNFMFSAIDPVMAQMIIEPTERATQNELDDEDRALSVIFTGGEPALLQGQNHAARLQHDQEAVQNSPTRQQVLATNGQIAEVYQNRLKFHQTQVAQQNNKQIGRLGGEPVLGRALSQAGKIPA